MIPSLGYYAIIIALSFSFLQIMLPTFNSRFLNLKFNPYSIIYITSFGQFIFLALSLLCLFILFYQNDMSVIFVHQHSHLLLPLKYRLGAAWSGHEGSLLLWCFILSGWIIVFASFHTKSLPLSSFQTIITILGLINTGFILFLAWTSNPFLQDYSLLTTPGLNLTPLLQDPALLIHPPILYLGYTGFSIGFAFAMDALFKKNGIFFYRNTLRPWIILPWFFLGLGMILGSWWAFRELDWGGWWFWDPVENVSLVPWLAGTALIHSLIASEKSGAFKGWTIFLAILPFALSLIGTFIIRSGILISAHSFANDPMRGLFLLSYLFIIIAFALSLYCLRIKYFYSLPNFNLCSRETFLLINSVVIISVLIGILLGTLYPSILDILTNKKISVGEPYFNTILLSIMMPLFFLIPLGTSSRWKNDSLFRILTNNYGTALVSLLICSGLVYGLHFKVYLLTTVGIFLGTWIVLSSLQHIYRKQFSVGVSHLGIGLLIISISINKSYSNETQLRLSIGETIAFNGFQFTFENIEEKSTPQFQGLVANFLIKKDDFRINYISPEQRLYRDHNEYFNKPGIMYNIFQDFYLTLGTSFKDESWAIHLFYTPCVQWIWIGGIILLIGGLLSLSRNYDSF